jgi:hypothetical protein
MGSDSDLPIMKDAARILNTFGVPHEVYFQICIFFPGMRQHWFLLVHVYQTFMVNNI